MWGDKCEAALSLVMGGMICVIGVIGVESAAIFEEYSCDDMAQEV